MIESSQVSTNASLIENLGVKVAELILKYEPTHIVSGESPFLSLVSHVVSRELHLNRSTAGVDLGVLKVDPPIPMVEVIVLLSIHESSSSELRAIEHHLLTKCKKLILVSISAHIEAEKISDFELLTKVVQE